MTTPFRSVLTFAPAKRATREKAMNMLARFHSRRAASRARSLIKTVRRCGKGPHLALSHADAGEGSRGRWGTPTPNFIEHVMSGVGMVVFSMEIVSVAVGGGIFGGWFGAGFGFELGHQWQAVWIAVECGIGPPGRTQADHGSIGG